MIKLFIARHNKKNVMESRLLLKNQHHSKKKWCIHERCFILSRLTYAVVKVLLDIKLIAQFEPSILSTKINVIAHSILEWQEAGVMPADTSKSHHLEFTFHHCDDGDWVRSVEVRRLELLTSCLQSRRSTNWAKPPTPNGPSWTWTRDLTLIRGAL